jgi:transposase
MVIVGVDWAQDKHELVVMATSGDILARRSLPHTGEALAALARDLAAQEATAAEVHVAIEHHDGALLAWFLAQGYTVYAINPKSAERARDRYRPGGGKDDLADAYVLADMLRTDRGALRPLRPTSELTQELRQWTRLRAALVEQKTASCQRLRALLAEWCPALSALCDDFNRGWQRELLRAFPLQQDLAQTHGNRLNAFAGQHRLTHDTRAKLQLTRQTVVLPIPVALQNVLRWEIRCTVNLLDQYLAALAELETTLSALVERHPDGFIFNSLPCHGTATVATLLAAFGDDRQNPTPWRDLAAAWGTSPVTIASGKSRLVRRRQACNRLLNQTLTFFAFNTANRTACWASSYYRDKRRQGTEHYTALRGLAQRWVKILYRLWYDRIPYDETVHQRNRQQCVPSPAVPAPKPRRQTRKVASA